MIATNPIRYVRPIGTATTQNEEVAVPSSFEYGLQDVSAAGAGRAEDTTMNKMRIGQTRTLSVAWNNVPFSVGADILQKFNAEYLTVTYFDAVVGNFVSEDFYVGNRNLPMYNSALQTWKSITFNLISRKAKTYNRTTNTWTDIASGVYAW